MPYTRLISASVTGSGPNNFVVSYNDCPVIENGVIMSTNVVPTTGGDIFITKEQLAAGIEVTFPDTASVAYITSTTLSCDDCYGPITIPNTIPSTPAATLTPTPTNTPGTTPAATPTLTPTPTTSDACSDNNHTWYLGGFTAQIADLCVQDPLSWNVTYRVAAENGTSAANEGTRICKQDPNGNNTPYSYPADVFVIASTTPLTNWSPVGSSYYVWYVHTDGYVWSTYYENCSATGGGGSNVGSGDGNVGERNDEVIP